LTAGEASRVPVFADATWLDGWPRADDPTPPDLRTGDSGRQGPGQAPRENMMGRFTVARHGRGVNVAFLDGHADTVPLERLKRLKWHHDFPYQDWSPPLPRE
jgi:prepilin-type processing-associated H-X9-DG protein